SSRGNHFSFCFSSFNVAAQQNAGADRPKASAFGSAQRCCAGSTAWALCTRGDKNMKRSRIFLVGCFMAGTLALPAHAADDLSPQGLLSVAKMAGACGILDSMIQLQRTTKLPGGEEFVTRFW